MTVFQYIQYLFGPGAKMKTGLTSFLVHSCSPGLYQEGFAKWLLIRTARIIFLTVAVKCSHHKSQQDSEFQFFLT